MTKKITIAQQAVKTFESLWTVQQRVDEKVSRLQISQPFYELFEHNNQNPYFELQIKCAEITDTYEHLLFLIADIPTKHSTIKNEINQIIESQRLKQNAIDLDIDKFYAKYLPNSNKITAKIIAINYIELFKQTSWLWSNCDIKTTKRNLQSLYQAKLIEKHIEIPFLDMTPNAKDLFKNVKKLGSRILELEVGKKTVRLELETYRTFLELRNQLTNNVIDVILTIK
jgi:hypothetical protein